MTKRRINTLENVMEKESFLYNRLENLTETFFKKLDVEVNKAIHESHRNLKQLELNLVNLEVDVTKLLEELEEKKPTFFDSLKGLVHSFLKQAGKVIEIYAEGLKRDDATSKIEYSKNLQDSLNDLRSFLDKIFSLVQKK